MRMFAWASKAASPGRQVRGPAEWFARATAPSSRRRAPLVSPHFALDGGEEPEVCGVYVVGKTAFLTASVSRSSTNSPTTYRAAELSLLAHSKLRPCSFGPRSFPATA
jgi:hypothetical protein